MPIDKRDEMRFVDVSPSKWLGDEWGLWMKSELAAELKYEPVGKPGSERSMLGVDLAVLSLDADSGNLNATAFMMSNASMVVEWKRAGLTLAQIAHAMNKLGFDITEKHVRNIFGRVSKLAKESEVAEFRISVHSKLLARSSLRPSARVSVSAPIASHSMAQSNPLSRSKLAAALVPMIEGRLESGLSWAQVHSELSSIGVNINVNTLKAARATVKESRHG